jgi:MoaA/NifB/PqqE/SkfB family radical SAM enzyme
MALLSVPASANEGVASTRLPRSYVSGRYYGGLLRAGWRLLTWRRAWNGLITYLSYQLARQNLLWKVPRYPLYLGIEPTTACQLRCPHCISGLKAFTRPTGRLDPTLLQKLLHELHPYLWGVLFYFQGEPLLHPQIGHLIQLASRYRLFTSLSTNGLLLTEEKIYELILSGLTHIRISIDGMSQESYARYRRGGELRQVLEGVERLLRMRRALRSAYPLVELQMIVFRHNKAEVQAFLAWARRIGVEAARLKTAQLLTPDPETIAEWIPPEANRYQQPAQTLPNRCWRLWRSAEVTWDGQVLPCCFDKQAAHAFGQFLESGEFFQLWHNPKAEAFRKKVFTHRQAIDICQNCSEGVRVWV